MTKKVSQLTSMGSHTHIYHIKKLLDSDKENNPQIVFKKVYRRVNDDIILKKY